MNSQFQENIGHKEEKYFSLTRQHLSWVVFALSIPVAITLVTVAINKFNTSNQPYQQLTGQSKNQIPTIDFSKLNENDIQSGNIPELQLHSSMDSIESTVEGVTVKPGNMVAKEGQKFVLVIAETSQEHIKWIVYNENKKLKVAYLKIPGINAVQVFPDYSSNDVIKVGVYTSIGGKPTDIAWSTINVESSNRSSPTEITKKSSIDQSSVKKQQLNISVITDKQLESVNKQLADNVSITKLEKALPTHKIWMFDQVNDKEQIISRPGFVDEMSRVGKVPMYIIQDMDGYVLESGVFPSSLFEFTEIVGRHAIISK